MFESKVIYQPDDDGDDYWLRCPFCSGGNYLNFDFDEMKLVRCKNYEAASFGGTRGSCMMVAFFCENGCEMTLRIAFHKGQTRMFFVLESVKTR